MGIRQGDYIQNLVNYMKKNISKGYTLDSLKISLEQQEYSRSAIDKAIQIANEQLAKQAPMLKEKPKIKYEIFDKIEQPILKKSFLDKIKELFR